MLYLIIGFIVTLIIIKVTQFKFPELYGVIFQDRHWDCEKKKYSPLTTNPVTILLCITVGTIAWLPFLIASAIVIFLYGVYKLMKF